MVRCFSINQGTLAGCISVYHTANGRAITGGKLRREEESVRFESRIELVLYQASLHPNPCLVDVQFEEAGHMAGQVNDQTVAERLPVCSGASTTGGEANTAVLRLLRKTR